MDPASIAALLKQGGLFAFAVFAAWLAWDYRKELKQAHMDRIEDLKTDRQVYMHMAERIAEELHRGRVALESLEVSSDGEQEEDDG